jgi:hypothetical protein
MHLYADVDKKSLSNFIKIRVSNCNLNIEKGRFLKLPVEQRICKLCHMDVEDEFHFLMNCDKLIHERVTLFRNISDIVPSFSFEVCFNFTIYSQLIPPNHSIIIEQ